MIVERSHKIVCHLSGGFKDLALYIISSVTYPLLPSYSNEEVRKYSIIGSTGP